VKLCRACGHEKPSTDFHKDKSKSDGLNAYCKLCTRVRQRAFAAQPPRYQAPDGLKRCQHCKQEKSYEQFHKSKGAYDGLKRVCKTCSYENHSHWRQNNKQYAAEQQKKWRTANPERSADHGRKHHYGVPLGTYAAMLAEQKGRCAICATEEPRGKGTFHIDHCHFSGRTRGLLCHNCNVGLGNFKHDPKFLSNAINYLAEGGIERGG
jgi:hypothetical protein